MTDFKWNFTFDEDMAMKANLDLDSVMSKQVEIMRGMEDEIVLEIILVWLRMHGYTVYKNKERNA